MDKRIGFNFYKEEQDWESHIKRRSTEMTFRNAKR